jgi:branched-chain amino acid transport system ATP-binding protein
MGRHAEPVTAGLIFAGLALAPQVGFDQGHVLTLLARIMIFAMAAVSLALLVGGAGLVSLGHAASLGFGAYAVVILDGARISDAAIVLPAAILASVLFATATGVIALRTSGVHFIMITLAFGQMAFFATASLSAYGGDDGYTLYGRNTVFGARWLQDRVTFHYVCLVALALTWLFCRLPARQPHRVRRALLPGLAALWRAAVHGDPGRRRQPFRGDRRGDRIRGPGGGAEPHLGTLAHPVRRAAGAGRAVRTARPCRPAAPAAAPMSPVLEVSRLRKAFGGLLVTDDVSLSVRTGVLHAVIGPNGAGKTTLIHQISGSLRADAGSIRFLGQEIAHLSMARRARLGLARSFQITAIVPGFTALENAALAAQAHAGSSFRFLRPAAADRAVNQAAMQALDRVGLASRAQIPAGVLSHGEKRQLELAIALAAQPRLLLLDEPLAGAGPEETERLIALLSALKRDFAVLLIEHDMQAVFRLADEISVLVYGRIIAHGPPAAIRADAAVRAAYLGEDDLPEAA